MNTIATGVVKESITSGIPNMEERKMVEIEISNLLFFLASGADSSGSHFEQGSHESERFAPHS